MSESGPSARPPAPDPLPIPVVDNHAHLDLSRDGQDRPDIQAVIEAATALPDGGEMRVVIAGPDFDSGKISESTFVPVLAAGADGAERLAAAGLAVLTEDGMIKIEDPAFGSAYYEQLSRGFDFYGDEPVQILRAEVASDRMAKEWFFLPALLLLLLLIMVQRRRATQPAF